MSDNRYLGGRRMGSNSRARTAVFAGAGAQQLDEAAVREAYRRWAPIYDHTFGRVSEAGRRNVVRIINESEGKVLEVGVGTGLSLPNYAKHLEIVGIDLAPEMLEKARQRVKSDGLKNVTALYEMDASNLNFSNGSFDTVVAMYVMTVVPDPERVMRELSRVVKPGGQVLLVNHFSQEEGIRGWLERRLAPFADMVGWHSVFDVNRVMVCEDLELVERRPIKPMGLFTMMRFVKRVPSSQA